MKVVTVVVEEDLEVMIGWYNTVTHHRHSSDEYGKMRQIYA